MCDIFSSDMLWTKVKSLQYHIETQLYSLKCGFNVPYQLDMEMGISLDIHCKTLYPTL